MENEQNTELEATTKELAELGENEMKQRTRMTELQNELQQTIKRIETLQRGGGGFTAGRNASSGNRRSGFGGSGTR